MPCKTWNNLSAFRCVPGVRAVARARHGFIVKAQRSAILWQVKYGCHPNDNSNISQVVKLSSRWFSVPFTRHYLLFCTWDGKKQRTLLFKKPLFGRKRPQFSEYFIRVLLVKVRLSFRFTVLSVTQSDLSERG